jgi:hypothetical protein
VITTKITVAPAERCVAACRDTEISARAGAAKIVAIMRCPSKESADHDG